MGLTPVASPVRIGIDLGGTKTAIAALGEDGAELYARRIPTPREDYHAQIAAVGTLIENAERQLGCPGQATIGVAMPGSISPHSGRVQNANSTWLNGKRIDADYTAHLGRPVRFANDANCLALSEATDGSAQGARSVFCVILGTGCGGGLVHEGRLVNGPRGIGGEWGHNPLPWPEADELPGPACWCGLHGCMEAWVSGPGLYKDYLARGGDAAQTTSTEDVVRLAGGGDAVAAAALTRHTSRLARGLASVVNIFDPEIIVLGGGLSNLPYLYRQLPGLIGPFIFADYKDILIRPPKHGDASGVRGAARLWDMT
jgi:fructokinase